MKHRIAGKRTRPAALAAVVAAAALWAGAAHAYTIITRDGHRIEAQSPPEVRGLQAYLRLTPSGQLAVIQEEKIDWARTEAVNGKPGRIAIPADAKRAEAPPERPEGAAPIEKRIVGPPTGSTPPAGPAAGGATQERAPDAPAPGSVHAQEAIAKLQAEHSQLAAQRDKAIEQKKVHAAELEDLQSRQAGYAGGDTSAERRVRELQDRIAEEDARIAKLEARMSAILSEVIQLGGSLP